MSQSRTPILYLPHGGGPLPLLGDPSQENLTRFLTSIAARFGDFTAVLMVSAHWVAATPTLTHHPNPDLLYDYYGFPPESYSIQYPAPGSPKLAEKAAARLQEAGLQPAFDDVRGFDHGMFVPMKLMLPDARIPCVQLSLIAGFDPTAHIAVGKALAPLRKDGVLIIGSGMSFHNLRAFFTPQSTVPGKESVAFDQWLFDTFNNDELTLQQREEHLTQWESAPYARYCHPYEDHLLPLHVCFGAACNEYIKPRRLFHEPSMGHMVSAYLWE
ncbi:MAG: dioxygenase [Anaerolineae bacterium]|nr:dioxygenase [Anaerolineae bacterium]